MADTLEWASISLSILVKDKAGNWTDRTILKNQNGKVSSGELLAVMGPTGCGKSSLLNVLAGKIAYSKHSKLSGYIYYNNELQTHGMASKAIAYVPQDERLFAFLTVRETLCLAAYFHAHRDTSKEERTGRVEAVIRELGLANAADSILGDETRRGVSGGEYKRVLIGKELIKNPSCIFLDEPTSGLDSFQALSVMDTMKCLARNHRIVLAVIHQPRSSIFAMFDRILLLSEGRTMYFGTTPQALVYFSSMGYVCPEHFNPADFYLDILSINFKSAALEAESRGRVAYFERQFASFQQSQQPQQHAVEQAKQMSDLIAPVPYAKTCWESWLPDFGKLFWRANANIYRNYGALVIRGATSMLFAVLLALIYRNLETNQTGIQNRAGLLYFVLINQGFSPLINTLNAFPEEKRLVTREILGGSYRFSSYYAARVLAELPMQLAVAVVYCTIVYWSTGLKPTASAYLIFTAIVSLGTLNACSLGFLISSMSPSAMIANAIGPPVFIILLLYGGFYINASSLPVGSVWVRNLSLVYWGFQALIINEFQGQTFTCEDAVGGCQRSGEDVIKHFSFAGGSISRSAYVLLGLTAGYFVLGYFGLLLGRQRYRRVKEPPEQPVDVEEAAEEKAEEELEGNVYAEHKEGMHDVRGQEHRQYSGVNAII